MPIHDGIRRVEGKILTTYVGAAGYEKYPVEPGESRYCKVCSSHGAHIADLSISEAWETGMPLKQLSTGFFCPFGVLSAAATSLSFGGRLRLTELPKLYKPL